MMGAESNKGFIDEKDISIWDLCIFCWDRRLFVVFLTIFFLLGSIFISAFLPVRYMSTATLMVAQPGNQGKLSSLIGQFGGLAGLAGLDAGGGNVDKTQLVIETLKSRQFVVDFLRQNELVVPLIAGLGENEDGHWIFDSEMYDSVSKTWKRKVSAPLTIVPSDWEIYEEFQNNVLTIIQDKKSGMIRISVRLRSASAAKNWLDALVLHLNGWMRDRVIAEKTATIKYLSEQIQTIAVSDMQKVFFSLIEKEETELMLAKTQVEYALKVIDPAVVSPVKHEPKRAFIVIVATITGFIIALIISAIIGGWQGKQKAVVNAD